MRSRASAWAGVLGNPSNTTPVLMSGWFIRSAMTARIDFVGNQIAAVHDRLRLHPDFASRSHRGPQHVAC